MLHEGIHFFAQIISQKMGGKCSIMEKSDLYLQQTTGDTHAAHTSSQPQHLRCSLVDDLYYVSLPSTGSMPPMQSWMDGRIVSPRTRLTSPGIQIHHQQTHATHTHTPAALVSRLTEWEILFTSLSIEALSLVFHLLLFIERSMNYSNSQSSITRFIWDSFVAKNWCK